MDVREIEALATLARLHFEPDELNAFADEFQKTLAFVNQLATLDTEDVPTQEGVLFARQREDIQGKTLPQDKVLQNAPQSDGLGFLIPKVL